MVSQTCYYTLMKTLIALLLCLAMAIPFAAPVSAQQGLAPQTQGQINIARKLINDKRNSAIAFNMKFNKEEKEKFWPAYRKYREAMKIIGDRQVSMIVEYANHVDAMTENKAADLLKKYFQTEKDAIKIKESYVRKFRRILPGSKVVRLMQIENRMDTVVAMKIAEGIPLME